MPILRALSARSSGSQLFCFRPHFTPICSAISFHEFWLGAKRNLSGKALEPCLDAIATSMLYWVEQNISMVARDGSDGPGYRVTHVSDNSVISFVSLFSCSCVEMSWGFLEIFLVSETLF